MDQSALSLNNRIVNHRASTALLLNGKHPPADGYSAFANAARSVRSDRVGHGPIA